MRTFRGAVIGAVWAASALGIGFGGERLCAIPLAMASLVLGLCVMGEEADEEQRRAEARRRGETS